MGTPEVQCITGIKFVIEPEVRDRSNNRASESTDRTGRQTRADNNIGSLQCNTSPIALRLYIHLKHNFRQPTQQAPIDLEL